jgi:hypothetical protein
MGLARIQDFKIKRGEYSKYKSLAFRSAAFPQRTLFFGAYDSPKYKNASKAAHAHVAARWVSDNLHIEYQRSANIIIRKET